MDFQMNFEYFTGKFISKDRHDSVPEYVAVPGSWIRSNSDPASEKRKAISFPKEQYDATIRRILAKESYQKDWPIGFIDIKSGFDSFEEAEISAKELNRKSSQDIEQPAADRPRSAFKRTAADGTPLGEQEERTNMKDSSENPLNEKIKKRNKILKKMGDVFTKTRKVYNDSLIPTFNELNDATGSIVNDIENALNVINAFSSNETDATRTIPDQDHDGDENSYVSNHPDRISMWTLRHKEFKEGLTELLPGFNVYVSADKFAKLKSINPNEVNPKGIAYELMEMIFCDHALKVCSLYGGHGSRPFKGRPGLDGHALDVMTAYMREYYRKTNYTFDEVYFKSSLRNRLTEYRRASKSKKNVRHYFEGFE